MCHSFCVPDWGGANSWSKEWRKHISSFLTGSLKKWELSSSVEHTEEKIHLRILADQASLSWTVYCHFQWRTDRRKLLFFFFFSTLIYYECISSTTVLTRKLHQQCQYSTSIFFKLQEMLNSRCLLEVGWKSFQSLYLKCCVEELE